MGQGVGELNVSLTARTAKASRGIQDFRRDVNRLPRAVGKANKGMGVLTGGLAGMRSQLLGIASLGGAALVIKKTFSEIDSLAKTSDKLGIATDQLAGLRFAAEQTGAGVRTLDLGLQRMVRRIAEAAQGGGEAAGAIRELGLSAEDLNNLTPDKQFRAIAAAMGQVSNQSDKVRLGFKLFDSEGVALVNTLAAGEHGLRSFQRQAESLGLAVSRDQAARIEKANDAINSMKNGVSGLGREISVFVAPAVGRLANAWANVFRLFHGGLDDVQAYDSGTNKAAMGSNSLATATDSATAAIKRQTDAIKERDQTLKDNLKTFVGELTALKRRISVSQIGEQKTQLIDLHARGVNKRGRDEFERLTALAKLAERGAEQKKEIELLEKRIRTFGKSSIRAERDEFLRTAVDRGTFERGKHLFDKLESLQRQQMIAEKLPGVLASLAKGAAELFGIGQDKKRKGGLSAVHREPNNILDANSAEGFAALRANLRGEQTFAQQQIAEQKKSTGVLESVRELLAKAVAKPGGEVFSFNG